MGTCIVFRDANNRCLRAAVRTISLKIELLLAAFLEHHVMQEPLQKSQDAKATRLSIARLHRNCGKTRSVWTACLLNTSVSPTHTVCT